MARILRRRPSPALVIALIALFVAMGGVSYGVATGSIDGREIKNNTVRSGDLRNNDIRGKDVRTGTITGSDVASNALKGDDIDESSLTLPQGGGTDTTVSIDRFTLTNGQTRTLATRGPISLVAECAINNPANNDSATVRAITTADNATLDAFDETEDVDPGTAATNREFLRETKTPTGTPEVEANETGTFLAPNGQYISAAGFLIGVNLPASGNSTCTFAGKLFLG